MDFFKINLIVEELEMLENNLFVARNTKDKRSRSKNIREATSKISDFANTLPSEVLDYLSVTVGVNPLNYQHAENDIGRSIEVLKGWRTQLQCANID